MSEQRAGWYDDPDDDSQLRYWDGVVWTDNRVPKAAPVRERAVEDPAPAGGFPAPGAQHPGTPQSGAHRSGAQQPGGWPYTQYPQGQHSPQYPGQYPGFPQQGYAGLPEPTTPDGARLATWGQRLGAWIIDGIPILVLSTIVSRFAVPEYFDAIGDLTRSGSLDADALNRFLDQADAATLKIAAITWLVASVYAIPFWMTTGRTPGKMVTGLQVRMLDRPGPLGLGAAILRRFVPLLGIIIPFGQIIDGLWPLWDRQRQTLHDKAAGTAVVVFDPERDRAERDAGRKGQA